MDSVDMLQVPENGLEIWPSKARPNDNLSQQNSGNFSYDSTMIERAVVAFAVEDRISDG